MRTKEFLTRLSVLFPLVLWSVFIVLILFGIVANLLGADALFYCDVYCKIGVTLFTIAFFSVIYCQAKSCWKLK